MNTIEKLEAIDAYLSVVQKSLDFLLNGQTIYAHRAMCSLPDWKMVDFECFKLTNRSVLRLEAGDQVQAHSSMKALFELLKRRKKVAMEEIATRLKRLDGLEQALVEEPQT